MEQEIQAQPPQLNPIPPNNKNRILIVVGIIALLIIIIVGGVVWWKTQYRGCSDISVDCASPAQNKDNILNWKTYQNEQYGFEFKYPQNFLVGKFKPETTPVSNVPLDIQEKQRDLSSNNAIVLVESEQMALFQQSPKAFSIDNIPIGEVPTISIKPITTSADFYRRNFIESDKTWEGKEIKIGIYTVTKLPGFPGPYGDAGYYYLLPISDNLIIEFIGFKQKVLANTTMTESHYDKVIEDIISTFKFTTSPMAVDTVKGLPVEIQSNTVFMDWYKTKQKKYNNINTFSHYLTMEKIEINKQTSYDGGVVCNHEEERALTSPDTKKIACISYSLGYLDLSIYDKGKKISGVLQSCTTCSEPNGFWLDNDRFILLSNYKDNEFQIYKEFIVVQQFDFGKDRSDSWSAGVKND